MCARALGQYSTSDTHNDAVKMLATVDKDAAAALRTLISIKSKSAYTPDATSSTDRLKVERAATKLIDLMDRS